MHGHTGFLITTRRLAPGVTPPLRKRRPAKAAQERPAVDPQDEDSALTDLTDLTDLTTGEWSPEDVGERPLSEKKIRRVRRSVTDTLPT
jgi:tRNA (adenine57-N1/adenine58-N1)-methyltransferase